MTPQSLVRLDPALNTAVNMSSTPSTSDVKVKANAKFTNHDIIMMKLLYHWDNKTYRELAEMYNTDYQRVYSIINKKSYKEVPLNFMTKIPDEFHVLTNNKYRSFKIKGHN